jgi:hypothetical protein
MSYASFTNLPASAKLQAHSVDVGKAIPSSGAKRRLTVLLISAAITEFLFVAIAAYLAAVLYHRLIVLYSLDPAKYVPEGQQPPSPI